MGALIAVDPQSVLLLARRVWLDSTELLELQPPALPGDAGYP